MSQNDRKNDPAITDKARITSVELYDDDIVYNYGDDACAVRRFAKTEDEFREMNAGELVRESRGTGVGYRHINSPDGCVFLLVRCDAEPLEDGETYYKNIQLISTDAFPTLEDAIKQINVVDSLWECERLSVANVTGESIDGMENYDVSTYAVTEDERLTALIRCQFIGDRDKLIRSVLKRQSEFPDFFSSGYREEAYRNAIALGVATCDERTKKGKTE